VELAEDQTAGLAVSGKQEVSMAKFHAHPSLQYRYEHYDLHF
jgi:hypothetical protein